VKYVRNSGNWLHLAPVIGCAISTEQNGNLSLAALTSNPWSNGMIQHAHV
jgi:hypothetical protein